MLAPRQRIEKDVRKTVFQQAYVVGIGRHSADGLT